MLHTEIHSVITQNQPLTQQGKPEQLVVEAMGNSYVTPETDAACQKTKNLG